MPITRQRLIDIAEAAYDYQQAYVRYVLLIEKEAKENLDSEVYQVILASAIEKLRSNEHNAKIIAAEIRNIRRIDIIREERHKRKWPVLPYHVFQSLFEEEGLSSSPVEKPNGEKQ